MLFRSPRRPNAEQHAEHDHADGAERDQPRDEADGDAADQRLAPLLADDRERLLQRVERAEALKREKREPTPVKVNPPRTFRQVELDLSRRTGTRVRITGEDKGRVELNYASREELDRILEILGYAAEE